MQHKKIDKEMEEAIKRFKKQVTENYLKYKEYNGGIENGSNNKA